MDDFSYDPQESLGFMTITVNRLMSASLRRKMREDGIDLTASNGAYSFCSGTTPVPPRRSSPTSAAWTSPA